MKRTVEQTTVVVIPAFNEERFIASVVFRVLEFADLVLVVDDGSTDRTGELAELAGAEVVRLRENRGKGAALNAGFRRALARHPAAIVTLDADAQHDAAEIPLLAAPILLGQADVVIGSRFAGKKSDIRWWRRCGQWALTLATNLASGVSTTDSQSGYRAYSVSAATQLRFRSGGLGVESETQFLLARNKSLRMVEVPIGVRYTDGNKRNPLVHGMNVIDVILALVARRRPLLCLAVPGVFLMGLGFMLGLLTIREVQAAHALPMGTAMVSVLLLTVGALFAIGGLILNTLELVMRRTRDELSDIVEVLSGAGAGPGLGSSGAPAHIHPLVPANEGHLRTRRSGSVR